MTPLRALSTESYQFSVKIAQIYDYSYVRFVILYRFHGHLDME